MLFSLSPFIILSASIIITRTLIALSSRNWIFLWAAIELNLLRFIPILINSKKFQETEAAVKYFLAQALGSRILLIRSISLWFNLTTPNNLMFLLLFCALILKIGMVPCHLWYPSVIASASWISCLILSTWQKLAPLSILAFIYNTNWLIVAITARINALIGGVIGINQVNLRSIIAYSSITHIGWITSLLAIYKPLLTLLYFALYCIIITPIFILFHLKSMNQRININKIILTSPQLKFILPILILSLGGIPPLTGFIPKWLTIYSMGPIIPIITIILISGAIINTYYYLNIIFNFSLASTSQKNRLISISITKKDITSILSIMSLTLFPIRFIIIYKRLPKAPIC